MESDNDYEIKFNEMKEYYQIDSDIECVLSINESFKPNVNADFIALQKEHDTSSLRQLIVINDIDEKSETKIVLPAGSLPKDEEDRTFYQLVYVSNLTEIKGLSKSFKFKSSELTQHELLKINFIEIKSTIDHLLAKCDVLNDTIEILKEIKKKNEEHIEFLRNEVTCTQLQCKLLSKKMVGFKLKNRIHKLKTRKVKFDLKNKTNDLKRVTNSMIDLTNENNQLKSYLSFIKNIKNIIQ